MLLLMYDLRASTHGQGLLNAHTRIVGAGSVVTQKKCYNVIWDIDLQTTDYNTVELMYSKTFIMEKSIKLVK